MPEDFLSNIQKQIHARLRELDGIQQEYDRLLAAADALGVSTGNGSSAARSRARKTTASVRRPARARARRTTARKTTATKSAPTRTTRGRTRTRASATVTSGRRRATGARKRAPRGANRDAVLAALRSKPSGASARELATSAGVGRVSTYQVLGRLESEGLVSRKERGEGPALYTTR